MIMCGKSRTGKTSLIRQYIERSFMEAFFPTPLPMADCVEFTDVNGSYELAIWDTAGADIWLPMNASAFHSPHVVIFVASFDESESLLDIVQKWIPRLADHLDLGNCVKILAINKSDLADRALAVADIMETKQHLRAALFEVSAKENRNVAAIFEFAARETREKSARLALAPVQTDRSRRKKRTCKRCC
jgi:small GTP-binding protein